MNVFRHLHAAGPLLVNDDIQKAAQFAATKFAASQNKNSATTTKYSSNFCIFAGVQSHLPQTCVVSWYSTIGSHQWCNPKTSGEALPFVNMIWKSSAQVGVGVAKGTGSRFYVVAYFMLKDANVAGNVPPVKRESSMKMCRKTGGGGWELLWLFSVHWYRVVCASLCLKISVYYDRCGFLAFTVVMAASPKGRRYKFCWKSMN